MKPTAILTADIHLREDVPACRTDDFLAAQWRKLKWLRNLQNEHGCPVLDAGDLLNRWKPSPELLALALQYLPEDMITVPGNHDLPGHNIEFLQKSGLAVLSAAHRLQVALKPFSRSDFLAYPYPWDSELTPCTAKANGLPRVAICHVMVWQGETPWPGCEDFSGKELLRRMTGYDLILTGDNHKPMVESYEGRLLVNPGSLMRTTAAQVDHRPRVYLWYADDNTVEPVYVPIESGVVSREHLEIKEEKDQRMQAFIDKLESGYEVSACFQRSLESFFRANRVRESVKQIVMDSMEVAK